MGLLFFLIFLSGCGYEGSGYDLYVLAGQSNMVGTGDIGELPKDFPKNATSLWSFTNAYKWERAKEPLDDNTGQVDRVSWDSDDYIGVGPGLSFADKLAERNSGLNIGLIPCAKGASSIDQWIIISEDEKQYKESLLGSCFARTQRALEKGRLKGLVWFQGEADTYSPIAARSWPGKLKAFVSFWRIAFDAPDLPVVFVQLPKLDSGIPRKPDQKAFANDPRFHFWGALTQIQAGITIPNVVMVRSNDLDVVPEGVHLTTPAYLELGGRIAKAMNELVYKK